MTAGVTGAMAGAWRSFRTRPVLVNSAALMMLRGANLAARLLVLFVLARTVSPATFGWVVWTMSLAEIAKVIADFGTDTLAIREYALSDDREAFARFAGVLGTSKLALGVLSTAVLAAWLMWTQPAREAAIGMVAALTVSTSLWSNFSLDFFQARLQVSRLVRPVLVSNLLLSLLAAWTLPRIPDVRVQVAWFPAIEAMTGLVLWTALRGETWFARARFQLRGLGGLLRRALPIAATALLVMTYSRLDVLVLASRVSKSEVGWYGLAFRLTEPFQIAAAAFGLSVFSRFSTWFGAAAPAPVRGSVMRYALGTMAYGVCAAGVVAFLAPPVLERVLPEYVPAIPILRLLAAALICRTLNATLAGIIQGAGRFGWITFTAVWNLVFVFALLSVLVPARGAAGAALALLIGEGVNSLVQSVLVWRVLARHELRIAHAR